MLFKCLFVLVALCLIQIKVMTMARTNDKISWSVAVNLNYLLPFIQTFQEGSK